LRQCAFRHDTDEGVEPPVERTDPVEEDFGDFYGAELAGADTGRKVSE